MTVLALCAASDRLSVAAETPAGHTAARSIAGARRHATMLASVVQEVLSELAMSAADLTAVAVSDGPGSFTGLRVAGAFAKGIVRAREIPLLSASTLLVRAWGAVPEGASGTIAGVGSALRGDIYVAVYRITRPGAGTRLGGAVELRLAPTVVAAGAALEVGSLDVVAGDLPPEALAAWPWVRGVRVVGPPAGLPDARALLELVNLGFAAKIDDPARWEPWYGRLAEAQARWEQAHGRPLVNPALDA